MVGSKHIIIAGLFLWIGCCLCEDSNNVPAIPDTLAAGAMICSILKNEQSYVDEWLDYHHFLGFDRVQLYDNAPNASLYIASLPEKYGSFVSVTHYPGLGKQSEAYKDCTLRNKESNMWGAFIDVDEFIVLRKHPNIKAFLYDVAPNGGSVVLGWSIMGSNNMLTRTPEPVLARFILTSALLDRHVKTIAYLNHVKVPNIHQCWMKPGYPTVDQYGRAVNDSSPYVYNNTREVAYINHYYTKSLEEFVQKRKRGWASSYKLNHLMAGPENDVMKRILHDFKLHNKDTNAVVDTFARDFYLQRYLGRRSNVSTV